MSESIPRLPVLIDFATGRALHPNGDEISRQAPSLKLDAGTTLIVSVEFVDRYLTPGLVWELTPHPLPETYSYMLYGGDNHDSGALAIFRHTEGTVNLPGDRPDGASADLAAGQLTFRVSTRGSRFQAVAADASARRCCSLAVAGENEDGIRIVLGKIRFTPVPQGGSEPESVDFADPGNPTPPATSDMTLNGLSGEVKLVDAEGEQFAVSGSRIIIPSSEGGGGSVIASPAAEFTIWSETYGRCIQLDATTPLMTLASRVWGVTKVRLLTVSADPSVTGNIVLIPVVNGIETEPVIVPVGAVPAAAGFELEVTGRLAFRRDHAAAGDTLKSDAPVSALILNWELEK